MSFNLTASSATYGTGKFGQALTGGSASGPSPLPSSGPFAVSVRFSGYGSGTNVPMGQVGAFWAGHDANHKVVLHYGNGGSEVTVTTSVDMSAVAVGYHAFEWNYDPSSGSTVFFDGTLVGSNAATMSSAAAIYTNPLEVRTFASGAFGYTGAVDELAFWNAVQHTSSYTPSTTATPNDAPGLLALYHFDGNTNDSAGVVTPATGVTFTGPTSGQVNVASNAFTVGTDGTRSAAVTVTPAPVAGVTFTPSSVTLPAGTSTATFTATSTSTGTKSIAVTNDSGLTNPPAIPYVVASTADTTPPTMNGTLTVSGITSSGFTLAWSAGSDNVGVAGYEVDPGTGVFVDVGGADVLSYAVSGKTPATGYTAHVRDYDAAGNRSAALAATVTTSSTTNNALANNTGGVVFSPGTWDIQASTAKAINAGAYFKTVFGGTACTLNFDLAGVATPLPQISYQVDGFGPWITVPIAASVSITMPGDTADYANKGGHFLEVHVKSMTETQERWATQATAVKLTGVLLDAGKTISVSPRLPFSILFYGDSITEGVRTVNMTAANDTDRNDSGQGWTREVARILGAEYGNIGFGATGFTASGSGGVPPLPSTYDHLYAGVTRSFSPSPDCVVLMEGTNDGGDVTAAATTVLNGLIAATTAKIIVLRPFKDASHATQLQAAIAACTTPTRCAYIDTAGFFNSTSSSDGLHPYGVENLTHIAPQVAAAIRAALAGAASTTPRTFSLELATGVDLNNQPIKAANLTGLSVAVYDQPTPGSSLAPVFKTESGTTDANGVLSKTIQSSLASGGTGRIEVRGPGLHYNGPVQVT